MLDAKTRASFTARMELAPAAKYADQAHIVRDYRALEGSLPSELIAERSRADNALTQSQPFAASFRYPNFGHSFISRNNADWQGGRARIGTFPLFACDMSNGSLCRKLTLNSQPTSIAERLKLGRLRNGTFRKRKP